MEMVQRSSMQILVLLAEAMSKKMDLLQSYL